MEQRTLRILISSWIRPRRSLKLLMVRIQLLMSTLDDGTSIASSKPENSDEFLRNFFIKFGMKRTLDSFQQEWFELKAKGQLDISKLPAIPDIYRVNGELSDELAVMQ
jgi:hypothetical protein